MTNFSPIPSDAGWTEPDARFLRAELVSPPKLLLSDILGPKLAAWVEQAAEAKGAPTDYTFAALLTVAGTCIGNARWVSPWNGWAEPPIIWAMCIGLPSSGKSPGIDALLEHLRKAERELRSAAEIKRKEWAQKAELAKLADAMWKEAAKDALRTGKNPPARSQAADPGPEPHALRLVVNDGTIEKLSAILARQPRGTLQMRDELSGWLEGMSRYSGGGSDRPFWLEAYGGRSFTVERMGSEPRTVERLFIGVLGGIQPDRLKTLLYKSDDDGLVARLLPIWPNPTAPIRPQFRVDESLIGTVISRLMSLELTKNESGDFCPIVIPFASGAQGLMDELRIRVRTLEGDTEGLLQSFVGKLPGTASRIALILAYLDWASGEANLPAEIDVNHFGRAVSLVEDYLLPMARRAYADASVPAAERAARRLIAAIRKEGWTSFTSREVMRLELPGLRDQKELDPALTALETADCIRFIDIPSGPKGGRPPRRFTVNPSVHRQPTKRY